MAGRGAMLGHIVVGWRALPVAQLRSVILLILIRARVLLAAVFADSVSTGRISPVLIPK